MSETLATLAGVTLLETRTTSPSRPGRLVVTPLLDDGTDAPDTVVIQSSALGIRSIDIGFLLDDDDDMATLEAAKDAAAGVTYVDPFDNEWTVLIAEMTSSRDRPTLWDCSAHLIVVSGLDGS